MIFPKNLEELINSFKLLPGVGNKTAERMAFAVLSFDDEDVEKFASSIIDAKNNLKYCSICGSLCDSNICSICKDGSRDNTVFLVVADPKDVFIFEKLGNFRGKYHVLGGLISPLEDIGPDDIYINALFDRVRKENIKEVILALKSGIESDTTALYIKKILERDGIRVSRIASGIPVGADMDYVDSLTLESALNNRKDV